MPTLTPPTALLPSPNALRPHTITPFFRHITNQIQTYTHTYRHISTSPRLHALQPNLPTYLRRISIPPLPNPLPTSTTNLANQLLHSLHFNTQIPRPDPTPSTTEAYLTTLSILHQRLSANNEHPVGRKIGFTNRSIWAQYNVTRPNWSYVYDSTVFDLSSTYSGAPYEISLHALGNLEPRIEPEIVLGLSDHQTPNPGMNPTELLKCVEWIAPGIEVVICPFRNWEFEGDESTAAFALHGRLFIGRRVNVKDMGNAEEVVRALEEFRVQLLCNGTVVDEGTGKNVLGSPLLALGHLVELLEGDRVNPGLGGGEVVTTGTLTQALPIQSKKGGEEWEVRIKGLQGVEGVGCRFVY